MASRPSRPKDPRAPGVAYLRDKPGFPGTSIETGTEGWQCQSGVTGSTRAVFLTSRPLERQDQPDRVQPSRAEGRGDRPAAHRATHRSSVSSVQCRQHDRHRVWQWIASHSSQTGGAASSTDDGRGEDQEGGLFARGAASPPYRQRERRER